MRGVERKKKKKEREERVINEEREKEFKKNASIRTRTRFKDEVVLFTWIKIY